MNPHIRTWIRLALLASALGALAPLAACSDDTSSTPDGPVIKLPDAKITGVPDASSSADAPPSGLDAPATSDCFAGTPTTNDELLNACTTAQTLDPHPTLPLLNTDGSLPAHP
jgi:hypothetical protein